MAPKSDQIAGAVGRTKPHCAPRVEGDNSIGIDDVSKPGREASASSGNRAPMGLGVTQCVRVCVDFLS